MDITPNTLMGAIHFVCFGSKLGKDDAAKSSFLLDLKRFHKELTDRYKGTGRRLVTTAAVRPWLFNEPKPSIPKREDALDFLREYLNARSPASQDLSEDRKSARIAVIAILGAPVALPPREAGLAHPQQADPPPAVQPSLDAVVLLTIIQALVSMSARSSQSELHEWFRGSDGSIGGDASYYLAYRYSTNLGFVLKGFLVVQKPPLPDKQFKYKSFLWGDGADKKTENIFRESEGIVLKLEKSYYLFGYAFSIPEDKRINPVRYNKIRQECKGKPSGIEVIACEYDDIRHHPGLFPGVTITLAAGHQPVVGRVALLHLGTKSGLGITLSDTDIPPGVHESKDLPKNLSETVGTIKKMGGKELGRRFQGTTMPGQPEETAAPSSSLDERCRNITDDILKMIDNIPDWELSPNNDENKKRKKARPMTGQGALETFGLSQGSRPRD